ncbi:hypothetical protein [Chitinophaga eiseniae]|uniref:Uncharacterized protein n=1 Tax=Chitinophaga eiseniae TaxID=634771 RepID=A0A847STL6_9BACT|nr:hypothetical protein [Chitinophaga eiseniae]NLR80879.1 hypothetical protein [Chitinophaga eiseniae]
MTLHLLITLLILLLLLLIQKRMLKKPEDTVFFSSLNILIIYLLLPLSVPLMAVIADFLFEGFTDNLVWYSLVFIPLWMISMYLMFRNLPLQKGQGRVRKVWLVSMNILLLIAYICAVFTSHHEHGPTPAVTDTTYLLGYFTGIQAVIIFSVVMQVWLLVKSGWEAPFIWIKMLLTVIAIALYLAILFDITLQVNF